MPPQKKLKPKTNLPVLDSYRIGADKAYWSGWPAISWESAKNMTSLINPNKLYAMALNTNFLYENVLKEVVADIRNWANIGEEYRVVSSSTNAPNALEYGDRVSDSLCKMM